MAMKDLLLLEFRSGMCSNLSMCSRCTLQGTAKDSKKTNVSKRAAEAAVDIKATVLTGSVGVPLKGRVGASAEAAVAAMG